MLLALGQSSVLLPGVHGAPESCVLSTASSHCTQVPFVPADPTQACGRHHETKLKHEFGGGYTGSGRNSVVVCKKRKGQCPAIGHERATTEQQVALLKGLQVPPKTLSLCEPHLLTVCEGETKEEMLPAPGK